MSMACNPVEGLVLAIQAYLLEGTLRIGEPWNTVEKHGYHLCIWYDYLRYKGIDVFEADERHLRNFLLGGATRYVNVISMSQLIEIAWTPTVEERFHAIVAFYDFWQRKRGKRLRSFRGGTIAEIDTNLFDRTNRSSARAQKNFARPALEKAIQRKATPTLEEAEKILDAALDQEDDNRAQTYYLIGSLALRSGSRAVGISSLTVSGFLTGLMAEREFKTIPGIKQLMHEYVRGENRATIVRTLKIIQTKGRRFIYCYVRNKGGGEPIPLAIPINLAIEIVDYICTHRPALVKARYERAAKPPPPNVFLSYKVEAAGGVLQPESFGNFFRRLFRKHKIDGSFHKFRAIFCQEVVRDVYIRERALHGKSWQAKNVIEFARQLLGHKNPKSIEHYLDLAMTEDLFAGEPVIVASSEDAPFVRAICDALTKPDADSFRCSLHDFVREAGLQPIKDAGHSYRIL